MGGPAEASAAQNGGPTGVQAAARPTRRRARALLMAKFDADGTDKLPGGDMANVADARLVIRKCQVCDWEGAVVERPTEVTDCPVCYGPTDISRFVPTLETPIGAKNPHAAALGRLGGLKGGRARAAALTAKERRAIAVNAAKARWKKARTRKKSV
jgi:hypothetical protein